jgi:hypothetical protein
MTVPPAPAVVTGSWLIKNPPNRTVGMATTSPARGPLAPMSNKAFFEGIGSRNEMKAPSVPMLTAKIGGNGMK